MTTVEAPEASSGASLRDFCPGSFALRDTWLPLVHAARVARRTVRRAVHGDPVAFWREDRRLRATEGYPMVERYGYAWVWYGNPEAASPDLIPNVPHIPVEGMPRHLQGNVVFDCSYELVCENLLDLTHADYLHSSLTGDPLGEDDQITVDSTSETVTMVRTAPNRPIPKMQRPLVKGAKTQDVRLVTLVHVRSGVCVLHGDFNPGMSIRMLHPVNPESRNRCRTTVTYNPKHMPDLARHLFALTSHTVGRQDNWALRAQNAHYLRPDFQKDMNSRFDRAGIRYRKVYQDLVARQTNGDYTYLPDGDPARDVSEELGLHRRVGE